MKALVYEGARKVRFVDVDDMSDTNDGELKIRMAYSGICGSDMHGYLGHDSRRVPPLILGHEGSGYIEGGKRDGERVVINPLFTCGDCRDCKEGRPHVCSERILLSIPPKQGCFAEYVQVPESAVFTLNDDLSMKKAALTEPLACSWHAVRVVGRLSLWQIADCRCMILGGGAIGLGIALVLRHFGVKDITLIEPNPLRHAALKAAGDFHVCDAESKNLQANSYEVVFDAYGGAKSRETSCRYIRPNGVILHIGLAGGSDGLDVKFITLQEVTFVGCYTYTSQDFGDTLRALGDGSLGDLEWIDIREFKSGGQTFEDIVAGKCEQPKIMLEIAGEQ